MESFRRNQGELLDEGELRACRTCMDAGFMASSSNYQISSLHDLLQIIEESDQVITFGRLTSTRVID
jgi:sulfur relay (sulfurtransferase) complex TusBCD TusD component (DsrE family)